MSPCIVVDFPGPGNGYAVSAVGSGDVRGADAAVSHLTCWSMRSTAAFATPASATTHATHPAWKRRSGGSARARTAQRVTGGTFCSPLPRNRRRAARTSGAVRPFKSLGVSRSPPLEQTAALRWWWHQKAGTKSRIRRTAPRRSAREVTNWGPPACSGWGTPPARRRVARRWSLSGRASCWCP